MVHFLVIAALLSMAPAAQAQAAGSPLRVGQAAPRPEDPEPSSGRGFTLELGIGGALTHIRPDVGTASSTRFGVAPLSIGIGEFVTPRIALLARIASTSFFEDRGEGGIAGVYAVLYGVHLQYWVSDRLMVSGGPGAMVFGENPFFGLSRSQTGVGASVRVGYALAALRHHSLRVAAEVFPAWYEHSLTFGTAFNFEWQYH
jgi:hypothetical protein